MYIIILHVTVSIWSRRHGNANSIPYIALNKLALISTWRTFKFVYNFLTTKSKCPEFFKVNQSYVTSFLRDVGCKRSKKNLSSHPTSTVLGEKNKTLFSCKFCVLGKLWRFYAKATKRVFLCSPGRYKDMFFLCLPFFI